MTTTGGISGKTSAPAFVAAADWGTSSFRLWLLDREGRVLGERRSDEGMARAGERGFAAILEDHLDALGAPAGLPVVVCGMAGARQGWREAPYAGTPASLDTLADGAVEVPETKRRVLIMPGVAQRDGGRFDVMRGEETQLMGLTASGVATGLVCLPGTHSKWARLGDGRIEGFSTFMTGELFGLLADRSILRHAVAGAGAAMDREAFLGGVGDALEAPGRITSLLFGLRAASLLSDASPGASRARLSGLLVGLEIAGARDLHGEGGAVTLLSSGSLGEAYAAALGHAGHEVATADAGAAVRRGLHAAALRLLAPTG